MTNNATQGSLPTLTNLGVTLILAIIFLGMSLGQLSSARAAPLIFEQATVELSTSTLRATTTPTFPLNVLISPTNHLALTNPWPAFAWQDAIDPEGGTLTYTLLISGGGGFTVWGQTTTATVIVTESSYTATQALPNDVYSWTVRVEDRDGNSSGYLPPANFAIQANLQFPPTPLIAPAHGATVTTALPTFSWHAASHPQAKPLTYTLYLTSSGVATNVLGQSVTATVMITEPSYLPSQALPNDVYTWTVKATDGMGGEVEAGQTNTFTLSKLNVIYLPIVLKNSAGGSEVSCPSTSINTFETIPIDGAAADRPGPLHADLNLSLRGFGSTDSFKGLIDVSGGVDPNAPQLAGIFSPNRLPTFKAVYQVNDWDWGCGANGCPTGPITDPVVTMAGLTTTPGEPVFIPTRNLDIFSGQYKAMVLYAEAKRITLVYTRNDSVVTGYTVHLENVCVDPNLLALYQAQVDGNGWHVTGKLPALRTQQILGTAADAAIQVVVRDNGKFMDPRSRKDWWVGY